MYGFRSLDHRPHSVPEGARLRRLSAFRPLPERSPTSMKLSVVYQPAVPASTSPYRVRDEQGRELDWANVFLDGQRLRQLSPRSLRIYAYDLLDFARWFELQHRPLAEITESTLVAYGRHQLQQDPKPTHLRGGSSWTKPIRKTCTSCDSSLMHWARSSGWAIGSDHGIGIEQCGNTSSNFPTGRNWATSFLRIWWRAF